MAKRKRHEIHPTREGQVVVRNQATKPAEQRDSKKQQSHEHQTIVTHPKSSPIPQTNSTNTASPNSGFTTTLRNQMSAKLAFFIVLCIAARVLYSQSKQTNSNSSSTSPSSDSTIDRVMHSLEPLQETIMPSQENQPTEAPNKDKGIPQSNLLHPTVFVGIIVRNKAITLPYFLRGLEKLNYPADRLQLKFIVDNSVDASADVLAGWIEEVADRYHAIDLEVGSDELIDTPMWSEPHYAHVIRLRQNLLDKARKSWADFYLSIDADVVLVNEDSLQHLVRTSLYTDDEKVLPVVAPLLNCTNSEYYANFWGAMNEQGYYARSENYFDLQRRRLLGVYPVAMVHSMFLINLNYENTRDLVYHPAPESYKGPVDDLIRFARSAQEADIPFYLDNTDFFGYLPAPVEPADLEGPGTVIEQWLRREEELFVHLRLQALIDQEDHVRIQPSEVLRQFAEAQLPTPSKLGFDEVYYINLVRREDRRTKMEYFLDQLGVAARHVPAMDGQQLTVEMIEQMGIRQLEGYSDPYHKRSLKFGEIGCFLSHYSLWQEMVDRGYQNILVLEDDVRFAPGFVRNLADVVREANTYKPDWDLIYIGRKRMSQQEKHVPGTTKIAFPDYTYWTLGYILKHTGAIKLLAQKPLKRMVAVDEYLPIMFNRHPRQDWLDKFEPRNLVALSAEPLLIEPQRYTGENHYISDTEDSAILSSE